MSNDGEERTHQPMRPADKVKFDLPTSRPSGRSDAGSSASQAVIGFVSYCKEHGILMEYEEHGRQWKVVAPPVEGFDVLFAFKVFPPGTTAATMQESLALFQLSFRNVNETAGLAMSSPTIRGRPPMPADVSERIRLLTSQVVKLFNDYRPGKGP